VNEFLRSGGELRGVGEGFKASTSSVGDETERWRERESP